MSQLKIKDGNNWIDIPASGIGVPSGGTTGQVLQKSSNTDYATEWASPPRSGLHFTQLLSERQAVANATHTMTDSANNYDALLIYMFCITSNNAKMTTSMLVESSVLDGQIRISPSIFAGTTSTSAYCNLQCSGSAFTVLYVHNNGFNQINIAVYGIN